MNKADFEYLVKVLNDTAGWDFGEQDYFVLDRKITNFIREKGYNSVEDLIDELRQRLPVFVGELVEYMAFLETSFFRDYHVFRQFEEEILPYLRDYNRGVKRLRVWSAGCSTGQEAYSIAIAIKRGLLNAKDWDIDIIGTDISNYAIAKAQKGAYSKFEIQMGMNAKTIISNFHPDKDILQANDDLCSRITFRKYNLLNEMTNAENFDVIFCRNVLKFFRKDMQAKILKNLMKKQTPGGLLYIGMNEQLNGIEEFYTKVDNFDCLYQANNLKKHESKLNQVVKEGHMDDKKVMPTLQKPQKLAERPPISELLKK